MSEEKTIRSEYERWINEQSIEGTKLIHTNDGVRFEADFAIAEINFYEFDILVIELRITNRKNDETEFFLHFELRDLDYARELFGEMLETFEELRSRHKVQVLLSCTSAFTTSLIAQKLNSAAEFLATDYSFTAVPFPELYQNAQDYDIILLAPQVAYESANIRKVLKEKIVANIPPRFFATYDTSGILEFVKREYDNRIREKKKLSERKLASVEVSEFKIAAIVVLIRSRNQFHVICRTYCGGRILDETEAIRRKERLDVVVRDVLDTVIYKNKNDHFDAIGVTVPGEIYEGKVYNILSFPEMDLKGVFEKRYGIPVIVQNNTKSGVLGFRSRHSHYQNCVLLSQSLGARFGGCGAIVNGRLVEGAHNSAGEIKYITRQIYGLSIKETYGVNPEEMLFNMDFIVRMVIGLMDPEIIVIRNGMIPDIDTLRSIILKSIPERNMPRLRKIEDEDALEYMLLGIMALSLKSLEADTSCQHCDDLTVASQLRCEKYDCDENEQW